MKFVVAILIFINKPNFIDAEQNEHLNTRNVFKIKDLKKGTSSSGGENEKKHRNLFTKLNYENKYYFEQELSQLSRLKSFFFHRIC